MTFIAEQPANTSRPGSSQYLVGCFRTTSRIKPVTAKAAHDVPALRPHEFAMLQSGLVIANPSDRIIGAVIRCSGNC